MEIIGLLGNRGVGKDYISKKIYNKSNEPTLIVAFADHFKIDAIVDLNIKYEKVFHKKNLETRKKLQELGTKYGRELKNPNIWIDKLENWIRIYNERGIKKFIVTDLRFQNEVDWIHKFGGIVIKVIAPNRNMERIIEEEFNECNDLFSRNHISETEIDKVKNYNYIIRNDYNNNLDLELKNIFNTNEN